MILLIPHSAGVFQLTSRHSFQDTFIGDFSALVSTITSASWNKTQLLYVRLVALFRENAMLLIGMLRRTSQTLGNNCSDTATLMHRYSLAVPSVCVGSSFCATSSFLLGRTAQ